MFFLGLFYGKIVNKNDSVNFSGLIIIIIKSDFICEIFWDMEVCVIEDMGFVWMVDIGGVVWCFVL